MDLAAPKNVVGQLDNLMNPVVSQVVQHIGAIASCVDVAVPSQTARVHRDLILGQAQRFDDLADGLPPLRNSRIFSRLTSPRPLKNLAVTASSASRSVPIACIFPYIIHGFSGCQIGSGDGR